MIKDCSRQLTSFKTSVAFGFFTDRIKCFSKSIGRNVRSESVLFPLDYSECVERSIELEIMFSNFEGKSGYGAMRY